MRLDRDFVVSLAVLVLLALPAMADAPVAMAGGLRASRVEQQLQQRESWVEDERKHKRRVAQTADALLSSQNGI